MENVRARLDEVVRDPGTAEALKPYCRHQCSRPNVRLVGTQGQGVQRITATGVVVDGVTLSRKRADGPETFHGVMTSGSFLKDRTPGRWNNERDPEGRPRKNVNHPGTANVYFTMLEEWRQHGELAELNLTPRPVPAAAMPVAAQSDDTRSSR